MKKTFSFLKDLKSHNDREWFEANKARFLASKAEMEALVAEVLKGILIFDKQVEKDTEPASCLFRIYKDVRFSKDKTPYKTHLGASINPGGRKSPTAGYYIHAEPGNSFIAGGVWAPEPEMLNAIRQEIDYHPEPLLKILRSKSFTEFFSGLDEEDKLKSAPKGYDREHPQIDLIRNRHFIVSHMIPNRVIEGPDAAKYIIKGLRAMHPFIMYLRHAGAK